MKKSIAALCLLAITTTATALSSTIPIIFYNFMTPTPIPTENVFLGSTIGPSIGTSGATVQWNTAWEGNQPVGLVINSAFNSCYDNLGQVSLNASLYTGDTISVVVMQPQQIPPGVACGCIGSACSHI